MTDTAAMVERLMAEYNATGYAVCEDAALLIESLQAERDRYAALLDELIEWPLEAESIRAKAKELRGKP